MRRVIYGVGAVVITGLAVWAFWPRPVLVEMAKVEPRSIAVSVVEEGEARIREVFTISAPIGGRLRRIDLHAGDSVVAGLTIVAVIGPAAPALLDTRARAVAEAIMAAAQSAVDLATAQVTQAEATAEFAAAEASRSRALYEKSAISTRLLDVAILEQRTALATLDSARANLSVRGRELESASAVLGRVDLNSADTCCIDVIAPVSGKILRVLTENEQVVPAGAPILEIGNPGEIEVVVELLSRDAVHVREDAKATITGWGGAPIMARVKRIEPSATKKVSALGIDEQRVEVILDLEGDPKDWERLGHGFRVVASISIWSGKNVLSIPVGALFRDGSVWATYVVDVGRAHLQTITLGERDDDFAQVLSGLDAGDNVILHPSDLVAEGLTVRQLPAP